MINDLAREIERNRDKINKWFDSKANIIPPIYSSFDIRNAGYKTVVVDSNVFPAGFNNLCSKSCNLASEYFKSYIKDRFENVNKIGLIVEYTRSQYYYDNILTIKRILMDAGFDVEIGAIDISTNTKVSSFSKEELNLNIVTEYDNKLLFDRFEPDLIVLNDDFSTTDPKLLEKCRQYTVPMVELGWFRRKKHNHFTIKNRLIKELSDVMGIDRCFIGAYFEFADNVNFKTKRGFDEVAVKIDSVINQIQKKYNEYSIDEKPFVFVKGNSSTYGMNAIPVYSGAEFLKLNSRTRTKLYKSKGGRMVDEVIIQEGVPTIDKIEGKVAEPVIYCVGKLPVGGFFRINSARSDKENLNSKGMSFSSKILCPDLEDEKIVESNVSLKKITVYNLLARLGALTIGYEMEQLA